MKCFPALALGLFHLAQSEAAILDTNQNGMSDHWEMSYNSGAIFAPGFGPNDDQDGDGSSNLEECTAGTDPLNGTPPEGLLQAQVSHIPAVYETPSGGGNPVIVTPEAFVISWPTRPGKLYTLLGSPDLTGGSWLEIGDAIYGDGNPVEIATLPTYQDGTPAACFFWRIAVADTDSDGDGFFDADEILKWTDPQVADRDDDRLPDAWEILHGLDPDDNGTSNADNGRYGDPDSDGLYNFVEFQVLTDPRDSDSDNDDLSDGEEINAVFTLPLDADSDDDGTPDGDEDYDKDGLTNLAELRIHLTDPAYKDTDNDKLWDGWELANGLDPLVYNSVTDLDGDGLTNRQEQLLGLLPLDSDSDDDGTLDDQEDPDGDGLANITELNTYNTHPLKPDTDGDTLRDDNELFVHYTNPIKSDTDADGMPDDWEIENNLNPNSTNAPNGATDDPDTDNLGNFLEWVNDCDPHDTDSDDDGIDDLTEVNQGSDPNDPGDGGNPPEDEVKEVDFKAYGDYASWKMIIRGQGPRDHRTIYVVTPSVGVPQTGVVKLRHNNRYKITLVHTDTKNDDQAPWYCWEARVDDLPAEPTFTDYQEERIPGVAAFFMVGDGHWLVDNRGGLFTTHNHRNEEHGGNVATGLEAYLLPVETVIGDVASIQEGDDGFVMAEANPTPSVEMSITSSELQGGSLNVRLQGTVRDSASQFADTAMERPQTLRFYHQDELLHSIQIDDTVGTGFVFDETVTIPNALPETYVIRAETSENVAGNKGYDESSVSLTWEEDASSFPQLAAPLSIAFSAAPTSGAIDQVTVFVGNSSPEPGDTASCESTADSLVFNGNLRVPADPADLTASCSVKMPLPRVFSASEPDSIVLHVEFTAPGFPKNRIYGRWVETGNNTLIFRPGSWVFGNQILKASQTSHQNLRGTAVSDVEGTTVRFTSLPEDLVQEGLKVVSGGVAYNLIKVGEAWYPEDPDDAGEIKRFVPSSASIPPRLSAPGYAAGTGNMLFEIRHPESGDVELAEILVVPGEEGSSTTGSGTGSQSPGTTPAPGPQPAPGPGSAVPDYWQPGEPVTALHVETAYRFLNANDTFAIELLDGYQLGGHQIETGDVAGDLDLDVTLNNLLTDQDNIWTIQIEEDINPVYAARLLFEGLKQASPYKEVFDHFSFTDDADDIAAFAAASAAAVAKTQETAIAATEMYLSGIGIANEGLDWILVVNDVSEGHWESLAGILPAVPAGLLKSGAHLTILTKAAKQLDHLDEAGFQALREFGLNGNLASAGTVFDDFGYSEFLRKVFTSDSGTVRVPLDGERGKLAQKMHQIAPRPSKLHEAHHDFPWAQRRWFAEHGLDVNDPAYGRWVKKEEHRGWHGWKGGEFNAWWAAVELEEKSLDGGRLFTKQEIIQKLVACRQQFPDSP
jgi:hypothetical protein